jgi:hypothetical protein
MRPRDVLGMAMDGRRLEQPLDLTRRDDVIAPGRKPARRQPSIEASPAPGQVLTEEPQAAEAQPTRPQVVGRAEDVKHRQHRARRLKRPLPIDRRNAQTQLELQQRMLRGQLAIQALGVVTTLDRLPHTHPPTPPLTGQHRREPLPATLAQQPTTYTPRLPRSQRSDIEHQPRLLATPRVKPGHRRRDALKQIGLQAGLGQRLPRGTREDQPGANGPRRAARHRRFEVGRRLAQLDLRIGRQRRLQRTP